MSERPNNTNGHSIFRCQTGKDSFLPWSRLIHAMEQQLFPNDKSQCCHYHPGKTESNIDPEGHGDKHQIPAHPKETNASPFLDIPSRGRIHSHIASKANRASTSGKSLTSQTLKVKRALLGKLRRADPLQVGVFRLLRSKNPFPWRFLRYFSYVQKCPLSDSILSSSDLSFRPARKSKV